jgi:enoyl-CoA hydratase/carnithine racemase
MVDVAITGRVARVTLNDAKRKNAMSEAMADSFAEAMGTLRDDDDIAAVVVTGAGDAFSAGGDLAMLERLQRSSYAEARAHMLGFYARFLSILDLEVPVVAAINGPAIGAGLAMAIAADVVVCAKDAPLAFNFVGLGLHPGMGCTYFLPRRTSSQQASELLYTGRRFTGADAAAWGLCAEACADGAACVDKATAIANAIAAQSSHAVRQLKRTLGVDRQALRAALEREASAQAESYASADFAEGIRALRERRPARFTTSTT